MLKTFLQDRVQIWVGDLTQQPVDAIVNAANRSLLGGGGVDGAIHRAGGPAILEACQQIRRDQWPDGLPTGKAVLTTGGNLRARYVIHTVGPIYGQNEGADAQLLADCYLHAMELAASEDLASMAFPAISTGVFGYPKEEAAAVVSRTLAEHLPRYETLREVRLVFFSQEDAELFMEHQQFG